jgi:uncharacterized membrane protein YidH (DUF202 family)
MIKKDHPKDIFNTISLLLAEKRTSLAILRTAIAIFTLPISVFTVLIATSRYYDIMNSLHFIIPLLTICIILIIFGSYLIFRSFRRIKDIDHKIQEIKKQYNMKDILDTC